MPSNPSEAEAAAIAAATARFDAETAPVGEEAGGRVGPWQRAALIEGVGKKATIEDLEGEGGAKWLS
ncbi:MAG TPA: hypothetical protein VNP96_03100 [Solirubrobacterales bacterium]|nr:hypothetical protein [Solirubrobacterales bacterium]